MIVDISPTDAPPSSLTMFSTSQKRKRHSTDQYLLRSPAPVTKKQKHHQRGFSQFPPAFWDNLSIIHLTSRALEEHDRRSVSRQPAPLPITQNTDSRTNLIDCLHIREKTTLQKIKQFARHGGPDLSDLRGRLHSFKTMRSRRSNATKRSRASTSETSTRSTGPYNRNFEQKLIDGSVHPPAYRYPDGQKLPKPDNWDEIMHKLVQPRRSLSPSNFSEDDFDKFLQADADATKEKQVSTSVIPVIEGSIDDAKCVAGGIPFNNLDFLTDGTLAPGNPDIYYGARPEQLDRRIRESLGGKIVPSTQDSLPICPNFFVAAKGPDGSLAVATRQATYDGALGARAMDSLRTFQEHNAFHDHRAHTITCIYHGGQLKMYTSHKHESGLTNHSPVYSTHQLNTWGMTGNINSFRAGATAYRNAREWAKTQRDEAITQANAKLRERSSTLESSLSSTTDAPSGQGRSQLDQESLTSLDAYPLDSGQGSDSECQRQQCCVDLASEGEHQRNTFIQGTQLDPQSLTQ